MNDHGTICIDFSGRGKFNSEDLDKEQHRLSQMPQGDYKEHHTFTPGIYARQVTMPMGHEIISKIHKTEHQFCILKGSARIYTEDGGFITLSAPYHGITYPGTRRALLILEECIWITFHPILSEEQPEDDSKESILRAVDKIAERIIEKREIELNSQQIKELCLK